jgi:uncharacterized protein
MMTDSHESVILKNPVPPDVQSSPPPTPRKAVRPKPGFLDAIGWLIALVLVIQFIPGFVAGLIAGLNQWSLVPLLIPAMFIGQVIGGYWAIRQLRRRLGDNWVSEMGLDRFPLIPTFLAILCIPGLKCLCLGIAFLVHWLIGGSDTAMEAVYETVPLLPWWVSILAIAVGPALNEELWFRGYLGQGLLKRHGMVLGILLTSLLFGVYHLNVIQGFYAIILGVALHLMYRATGSLWVPIVVHFLFNAMAVAAAGLNSGESNSALGVDEQRIVMLIFTACLAVMAAASYGLFWMRIRRTELA